MFTVVGQDTLGLQGSAPNVTRHAPTETLPHCKIHRCPIIPELRRCLFCEEEAHKSAFQGSLAEHLERLQEVRDYQGETFLVDSFMADGLSREEAITEVESPLCLEFFLGTVYVDKDRYLAAALGKALLRRDPLIVKAQARLDKPPGQRGPKRNPKTGKFKYEQVTELTADGKKDAQIAKAVSLDLKRGNRTTATRDQRQKSLEKEFSVKRPKPQRG